MCVFLTKQIQSNIEKIERRERRDHSHCNASPRGLAALVPAAPWWFRSTVQCPAPGIFFFLSFFPLAIHEIANL